MNRNTKLISNMYQSMKNKIKIIYVNEELTYRSMQTLIKYKSKIGLADSLNIEVMEDLNMHEIVSFDPDFDNKENIIRIH